VFKAPTIMKRKFKIRKQITERKREKRENKRRLEEIQTVLIPVQSQWLSCGLYYKRFTIVNYASVGSISYYHN
jgi:hypothetical protein